MKMKQYGINIVFFYTDNTKQNHFDLSVAKHNFNKNIRSLDFFYNGSLISTINPFRFYNAIPEKISTGTDFSPLPSSPEHSDHTLNSIPPELIINTKGQTFWNGYIVKSATVKLELSNISLKETSSIFIEILNTIAKLTDEECLKEDILAWLSIQ